MAHAEADDLAAIFFGDRHAHGAALAGWPSQRAFCASPCDSCESCDSQASMRVCGPVQGLRPAATGCDSGPAGLCESQKVAAGRSRQDTPQTRANAQESQKSQQSQGGDSQRAATAGPVPEFLTLVAWSDADIARFTARRDRLIRWGYSPTDAEALAERLTQRDRAGDDMVSCTECSSYRPGRCGNYRRAGLVSPELGHDLAALLQRCPGFKP